MCSLRAMSSVRGQPLARSIHERVTTYIATSQYDQTKAAAGVEAGGRAPCPLPGLVRSVPKHWVDPRFPAAMRRLRHERGMSVRDLARLAFFGKTYIHELETGRKEPTPETAARLDDALRANGDLSALVTAAVAGDRMPRREFVAAAGLAAAFPYTAPLTRNRTIGAGTLAQLRQRTARLRRLDDYLGGADTYAVYLAEFDATAHLAREAVTTEALRRNLMSVLGEQAQMAGWAAFDAGLHSEAERLYQLSHTAALEAGDRALAGNALAFLAYQAPAGGQRAVGLARDSVATAGDAATPAVRALLQERRAWAHALAGDEAATGEALDLAGTALVEHDGRPEPDWVFWVDRTEIQIMAGRCWSVLCRPVRATMALEQALGVYDDTHARDKALYLSWLADAYLDANEVDQACAATMRTMQLATGVGSIRPQQRVKHLVSRLEPHRGLPVVAEVRAVASEWFRQVRLPSVGSTPSTPPTPSAG